MFNHWPTTLNLTSKMQLIGGNLYRIMLGFNNSIKVTRHLCFKNKNFWTFRHVIQLIEQLFKIRQKAFCWILKRWFISRIKGQNILRSQIFAIFEAQVSSNLNRLYCVIVRNCYDYPAKYFRELPLIFSGKRRNINPAMLDSRGFIKLLVLIGGIFLGQSGKIVTNQAVLAKYAGHVLQTFYPAGFNICRL